MDTVRLVLMDFQFIEECLRMYIAKCYEHIACQLRGAPPFQYGYRDLEKDSLGKLVGKFEKLNRNSSLISELRRLTSKRNQVAHRAFLLTYEEVRNDDYLKAQLDDIVNTKRCTKECFYALLNEWREVEKQLGQAPQAPRSGGGEA